MATLTKLALSGSVNGKNIKITANVIGSADTIHTAQIGTSNFDEIWLWAVNTSAVDVVLTIAYGGVSDPDDYIVKTIPSKDGFVLILPGIILQNELIVKAFAGTANVINVNGFVNRIG